MGRARFTFLLMAATAASPAFAIGDFGPDTCIEGFVWREACGGGDRVCVAPAVRERARLDNREAGARVEPGGGPYGPDTCRAGYVWREACGPGDHVCVPVETRTEARRDNGEAGSRKKYPFCTRYAQDAIQTAIAAASFNCGFSGPRWTATFDQHFRWCLDSSNRAIGQELQGRGTELTVCRQSQP